MDAAARSHIFSKAACSLTSLGCFHLCTLVADPGSHSEIGVQNFGKTVQSGPGGRPEGWLHRAVAVRKASLCSCHCLRLFHIAAALFD